MQGRLSTTLATAAACAVPFVPFVAGWTPHGIPGAAMLGAACFLAPGAVGVLWSGRHSVAGAVSAALLASFLLNLTALVLLHVAKVEPSPVRLAAVLGALTAVGAAAAVFRTRSLSGSGAAPLWGAGAAAFLLFAFAGTRVVPPLEDQDFEVQATANGLVRELSPVCLTNRSRLHFFAHPPLLHFWSASTLVLAGQLEDVRPAYDAAVEELAKSPPERGMAAVARAFRDPPPLPDRGFLWASRVFPAFRKKPALLGTRAPNFVLGALAVVLVFAWARRLGVGVVDATLAASAYATLPEVLVRSGYGGYYAGTAALMLTGAWLAVGSGGRRTERVAAGALAALVNHKTLLLGVAAVAWRLVARRVRCIPRGDGVAWLVIGLIAGSALFWAWGLALAPADFVGEHVRDHGLQRFSGGEVLSRRGEPVYPSRSGVWLEFARHMGWVWSAVALAGVVSGAKRAFTSAGDGDADAPAHLGLLVAWVLVVAAAFTLTDWRQTKHLCLLVPAAAVLTAAMLPAAPRAARMLLRAGLGIAIAWNIVWIFRLAADFDAMTVTPIW